MIVFDWKRTLYDPEERTLIADGAELLAYLKDKQVSLALVGKGDKDMYAEVERLGVQDFFSQVVFREGAKDAVLFKPFVDRMHPEKTIFVGDRVRSELAIGNALGATTVWVRSGKFADEPPADFAEEPTYIVNSLSGVRQVLEKHYSLLAQD